MICYKDMTFCESRTCKNDKCDRQVSKIPKQIDLPIQVTDMSSICEDYKEVNVIK